jgi:hypothetical protein
MKLQIEVGEKFATWVFCRSDLSLSGVPTFEAGSGLWFSAMGRLPFELDQWWRRQLGELVAGYLEKEQSVCFIAKERSITPRILDDDTRVLERRVRWFVYGLLISVGAPQCDLARLVSGGRSEEGFRLKLGTPDHFVRVGGMPRPSVDVADLERGARFASRVESMDRARESNPLLYWRVMSGLEAFVSATVAKLAHIKLHQFVRAIESLMPSTISGADDFARFCRQLCSASVTDLREMYQLRNMAEHHQFHGHALKNAGDWAKTANARLSQAENLCREMFKRFFADLLDFELHFRDEKSIKSFWRDPSIFQDAWGPPVDMGITT